jgi:hypothetical protein
MSQVAVGTIAAKNYLSYARVLADSLLRHHPDVALFALLADEVDGHFDPEAERFRLLRLADVGIPGLPRFLRRHSRKQVAVVAKPYLLSHLLGRGFGAVIFLDPDVLVLGGLDEVFSRVRAHSVVLTPHLLAPLTGEGRIERELTILQSGVFNAGFIGVSDAPSARAFLAWWQDRVYEHCRHDVAEGFYYDQRWLDLVPVFFEDVHILRDPACNVAHWNLPEREVRVDRDRVLVDGRPCRFAHFSGFDPDHPIVVTRYSSRLRMSDIGQAALLFAHYADLLRAAGYRETKGWPYALGRVDE